MATKKNLLDKRMLLKTAIERQSNAITMRVTFPHGGGAQFILIIRLQPLKMQSVRVVVNGCCTDNPAIIMCITNLSHF